MPVFLESTAFTGDDAQGFAGINFTLNDCVKIFNRGAYFRTPRRFEYGCF